MTEPSGISGKLPVTSDVLVRAREALDARGHPIMDGHGHVRPRIDGQRARCGGPRICKKCQAEAANMADPWQLVADLAAEVEKLRAEVQRQREGDWSKLSRTLHNAETERDRLRAEVARMRDIMPYAFREAANGRGPEDDAETLRANNWAAWFAAERDFYLRDYDEGGAVMSGINVMQADNPLSVIVLRELADIAEAHDDKQVVFKLGDGRMVLVRVGGEAQG